MHPAYSIIVFTTLSGLGYGLAAVLGLGLLDPAAFATKLAYLLALALIGAGLLSSTLHLGNPQRAWRAFSQWRSSWLSREGVLAVITFVPLSLSALAALVMNRHLSFLGLLGALLCLATVYCTSMIYASLRSVDAWHTPLTPLTYLLFSASGGLILASVFALAGGGNEVPIILGAVAATLAAWIAKLAWWQRLRTLEPRSTPESATGLGIIGKVRLFERPHSNENYLTREMGYQVARKHAAKLFGISAVLGGALPLLLLAILAGAGLSGAVAVLLAELAAALHLVGMLVERWLFFASARHSVTTYYAR